MKNKTLQDFRDAFFGDDDRKDAGDKHFYGVVKSLKTNANGKVVGYYVNLGGDSGTTYCRKLAGAKVGNTVMVTLMGNSKVATVTGTLNGDTDVEDVKGPLDDLIGRVDDGEFTPAGTVIQYCLATAMVIPTGGSFDDIQYTDWSEELPAYQVGYYYWMRTVTVMEDETEIESEPVFALSAQTAAEANDIATSTNNYFWHDNTGAWITKVDQATYQTSPTGPAVQVGASGTADYLDGILLASRTASGTTFYGIDQGIRKELVTYGLSGTVFNSDYPFTIGNNNSYIKWEYDSTEQKWKIKINADEIEMGGSAIPDPSTIPIIGSVVNYYLATSASSGVTKNTQGWTTTVQSISSQNPYLWNYEEIIDVDNSVISSTSPVIIGRYGSDGADGDDGNDGKGISSITEYYARSSTYSEPSTSSFSTSVPTLTATYKYMWNYEVITYTDNTTHTTSKRVIAIYGDKGDKGDPGEDSSLQYMAFSSSTFPTIGVAGLQVYTTKNSNCAVVNSDGMHVFRSGTKYATFGPSTTIGVSSAGQFFAGSWLASISYGGTTAFSVESARNADTNAYETEVFLHKTTNVSDDMWFTQDKGIRYSLSGSGTGRMLRFYTSNDSVALGNSSDDTRLYGLNVKLQGGSTTVTSDIRLKDHIKNVDYASDIVLNIEPFEYQWISDINGQEDKDPWYTNEVFFGFSAQQLETLMKRNGLDPERYNVITEDKQGYMGIRYESMIPLLVKTIQDLNARVEQLEGRVA